MSEINTKASGYGYCATVGFAAAMCGVWGFNVYSCGGVLGGTLWTLYVAGFFMFVPPLTLLTVLAFGFAVTLTVRALSRTEELRGHIALALLVVPLACLPLAYGLARAVGAQGSCSLGHWK